MCFRPNTHRPDHSGARGSRRDVSRQKENSGPDWLCSVFDHMGNSISELKNLPAMQETWVRSLSWGDPLEKGKVTHSRILAWRIPWTL